MACHIVAVGAVIHCDTFEEYESRLAEVQSRTDIYTNVVGDPVAFTITMDVDAPC